MKPEREPPGEGEDVGFSDTLLDSYGEPLSEACHSEAPELGKASPVELDPLDLMQGFGGQVALSTVGTGNDRNAFSDQERAPLP